MNHGRPIRAYETMRGWWATTVRVLSLVLVLALVVPGAIHSAEAHRPASHELSVTAPSEAGATDHSDACPACHANCGCHQALGVDATPALPHRGSGRASYATVTTASGSVSPDRLPRPPRA
ncbi:hypothetical protein [Methylobacterium haplocladii]|uniref:DUF2946 domain-containing protein n=1 Tax=Methylobacterium haplocladii TaxID=1176176 RepID=A0A512IJK6_9HYPH|nr:hypothetical protein [Methylobacterium haplocladii]GEO97861.1 hypothetical protein MHA02_02490 [Methylobacterium haplocladii]GJD82705.1 hypothetical protein HPGCJGGD_0564 [Methylobacterium haplocladii]